MEIKKEHDIYDSNEILLWSGSDSPVSRSLSRIIEHSDFSKEMIWLVTNIAYYTGNQGRYNDLFVKLYENRNIDEPIESKIIRYRLLLNVIERNKIS